MADEIELKKDAGQQIPPIGDNDPAAAALRNAGERLGGGEVKKDEAAPGGVVREQPKPAPSKFDLTNISPEMLYELKEQLDALPARATRPVGRPIIRLRKMEDGIVIDIGTAFNTLRRDDRANQNVEEVMMPVKFLGATDDKFVNVPWREFMQAPQIECEILSRDSRPDELIDGAPVRSRESGQLIERVVRRVKESFRVKLPAGSNPSEVVIEAKIANA